VADLFTRKVVGWSMRPDMHRSLVIDALDMGVYQRRPQPGGLIFHSDRGLNTPARISARSSRSTACGLR
jgi:putative transposase